LKVCVGVEVGVLLVVGAVGDSVAGVDADGFWLVEGAVDESLDAAEGGVDEASPGPAACATIGPDRARAAVVMAAASHLSRLVLIDKPFIV
jgi:hypothetical protein